jgi:hypothetical protein
MLTDFQCNWIFNQSNFNRTPFQWSVTFITFINHVNSMMSMTQDKYSLIDSMMIMRVPCMTNFPHGIQSWASNVLHCFCPHSVHRFCASFRH